jgi:hypothetical protein
MKWIIGGIIIIGIVLVLIEYSRKREGVTTSPPPQTVDIPPFFKQINKCDYPMLWRIGEAPGNDLNIFFKNASEASKTLCDSSNPNNITNQKEVCGYTTDLINAYSGKIMETCPQNPDYDGDRLNTKSVCSLSNYYTGYKKIVKADPKVDQQQVEKMEASFFDQLKKRCSQGSKNACIIGDALKGILPTYCSPPPTVPPEVFAGKATF